ncbi:MAG: class B sortase [Coriobacteriales bacterium]|nr:class B sortase [Coriobacteriales bacterium]
MLVIIVAAIVVVATLLLPVLMDSQHAHSVRPAGRGGIELPFVAHEDEVDDEGFPVVDWEYWRTINPAIVGWVSVPGTNIDYAVVQASPDDPDFYLNHDIYGNRNAYGCPYVDADCVRGMDSPHVYIFGHHMDDGTMFAGFVPYSEPGFAAAHRTIYLQTPAWKKRINVAAVDIIPGETRTRRTAFANTAELQQWFAAAHEASDVQLNYDTSNLSQLFTFVTCSYHYNSDERTLVFAPSVQP